MFNGYNETPLLSYNEFNQDRIEKKQENVPKWSYGHDAGGQSAQSHPNNRHSEFWSGKSNFLGLPNVVKCSCPGCYPSSENQSYQGDTSRHRPWLPRTFPVLLNNPSESCKLPAYQWDNGLSSQSSCYPENNVPYMQENGGKYPYYRHYQNSRLPESNQPGVITSVKNAEYVKKPRNEMSSRTLESPIQNGTREPVFCNPAYNLTKRTDGRNYCDPNNKYSNLASYSVDQHIPRLPVVEPFIKAVPSNLSQNRVPSTGYRSVKENIPQPYIDSGFGDARKVCPEPTINSDKRNDAFSTGQLQTHTDHSHLKRDLREEEPQKLLFDNSRHPDYFPMSSIQDAMKRNNQILDNRKDYMINQISQMNMPEQHYNMPRSKYQEVENSKSSYEAFYPEEFEKMKPENHLLENSACFQRIEDTKSENTNIHPRVARSALLFNSPRFDNTQHSFSYQSDPVSYRNHIRPEYSYQNFNSQVRFEHPAGFQRNDFNQYKVTPQQIQNGEQFSAQQNSGFVYNLHCQPNSDKTQKFCGEKNPSSFQADPQAAENKKINYLEAVRSEEVKKNGTSKISPLRLLRKKKFINVPHESTPASTLDSAPSLDVRKFWSTWAEEEEENLAPSQMVVLDCQNIDPEQAKLFNLYETDPVRAVHFESGNIVIKGSNCTKDSTSQIVQFEQIKTSEEFMSNEPKIDEQKNCENEKCAMQQKETEKAKDNNSGLVPETESKSAIVDSTSHVKSPSKLYKKVRSEQENRTKKKTETMDKWTEKKFDFLKRAEESKAAEILRHEEEKKKIFETRQSIQQSLKKTEKQEKSIGGDENVRERISSFDDNLQSDSPQDGSSDTFNLPTSEYRRNKFLDYSDRKITPNGKDKAERNVSVDANSYIPNEPNGEIKKEENVKFECSNKKLEKDSTQTLFSSLNTQFKEETDVEIDDILKKVSDINFQSSEIKIENEIENNIAKKSKPLVKKPKKKKSDLQTESDERKDKVTVETVSKPTIKFSIQKSHDLKISFKVLNSSKEYSDVDVRGEDIEAKGNAIDDSKNSTELITLKYKSIQRDGDRRQNSDFMRNGRGFRRKKRAPEKKTPVLKIKKSRYLPEEERDSLGGDEYLNTSKEPYSDEYATSEDFQVQETVDSAKIKLTFKRHKGNFETEYKINSNDTEKVSAPELELIHEDFDKDLEMTKSKKKSRRAKKKGFLEGTDVECFKNNSEPSSRIDRNSENPKTQLESVLEEDSKNSSTSLDSCTEKENWDLKLKAPIDYDKFVLSEEKKKCDVADDLKMNGEINKFDQEQVEFTETHVIKRDENSREESSLPNCNPSPCVNLKEIANVETLSEEKNEVVKDFKKEEIQEISIDFIKSTKLPEIETNHLSGETEETETLLNVDNNTEALKEKSSRLESSNEIKHFDNLENSYVSEFEKNSEKTFASENLKIIEDFCDWKDDPLDNDDADKLSDNLFDNVKNRSKDSEGISDSFLSPLEVENETFRKKLASPEKSEAIIKITKTNELLLPFEKTTEAYPIEECMNDFKENCENNNPLQPEPDKITTSDLELGGSHLTNSSEDFVKNDITCKISPLTEKNRIFLSSETSPNDIYISLTEFKNSSDISEKLNEDTNNCEQSPSPSLPHIEPEKINHSNFEVSLESAKNTVESDLERTTISTQRTPEVIASVIVEPPNEICENSSSELSPKINFSKFLESSVTERLEVDYSPSVRKGVESSVLSFEKARLSLVNRNDSSGDAGIEADANGSKKVSGVGECSFPSLGKPMSSEASLKGANNLSIDTIQSDKLSNKRADGNHVNHSAQGIDLSPFQGITKNKENFSFSPKTDDLERLGEKLLGNISGCTTPSDSNQNVTINFAGQSFINNIKPDLPSLSDVELEDGEIIDSSDDLEESSLDRKQIVNAIQSFNQFTNVNNTQRKHVNFISRNIKRRHSTKFETLNKNKESQNLECETWSEREFSRAKSCPPGLKIPEELFHKTEETPNVPTEDIPLPVGPPPYSSCLNLKKYLSRRTQEKLVYSEAKEKPEKSIALKQPKVNQKEIPPSDPPFGVSNFQNSLNPVRISPPLEKNESAHLGIFQRSSKIKFSFSKRSRFSKIGFKGVKESQFEVSSQATSNILKSSQASASESKVQEQPEKKNPDFKSNKKIRTLDSVPTDKNTTLKECQIEEVPNAIFETKIEETKNFIASEEIKKSGKDLEQPVALLCEDLSDKVEAIDALTNFITDEFYECEDIPTSEDLTNGDDLENEKVNDDKFRNIMQNCLDNAKKFLNVGNLKLFSCSVDDLLELDCQASESALGESEPEKPNNHISRDVLLTSCEDTSDDLGLSENVPPPDISMDFVPSFCSDVCSEILPVDNWPYLEEEVPSSPTKLKQDETDLIPSLENTSLKIASESYLQFCPKNEIERGVGKEIVSENNLISFRRRSFISEEESLRMGSKIDAQRRKTIESFSGESCGRDICDIKSELVKLNNGTNEREKGSLKCRLSLEKLTNKHEINFKLKNEKVNHENKMEKKNAKSLNYKSPSWQPRVMLFRISKNDLRKVVKSSNTHKMSKSKNSGNWLKKEISDNPNGDLPAVKKQKFTSQSEGEEKKVNGGNLNHEKLVNLPRLDSIKGSLTAITTVTDTDVKGSRKSRFRNLHSKRKIASDKSKDEDSFAQNIQFTEPTLAHTETVLIKMFKDSNRSSNSLVKNTKEVIYAKNDDEKLESKLSEIKLSATENHHNANFKSEERLETSCSRGRSKEYLKEDKHCEKAQKSHSHRDKRKEKKEGKEERKQKDRHKDVESKKYNRHGQSRHLWRSSSANSEPERCKRERCRSASGRDEKKWKSQKEASLQEPWTCEVCGFDDVNERVVHIKSHPFHCQSCHLAFKTEAHFISHLTRKHKDIRNQHHCLLCELSFDTQEQYHKHLETREHRHLESVEKNTINTLFTLLTGAPCPVLGLVEVKPEWLPNQAGTVHFYHQATPLSLALQFLNDCFMGPEVLLTFLQTNC